MLLNLGNRRDILRERDRKRKIERIGKNKIRALVESRSIGDNKNLDSGAVKNHTHTYACMHAHTHTHILICNHNAISRKDIYITEKAFFTLG